MSLKRWLFLGLLIFCTALPASAASSLVIRYATDNPFPASGEIAPVWKTADKAVGFVIPGKYTAETFPTEGSMLFDKVNLYILLKGYRDLKYNALTSSGIKGHPLNNFEIFLSPDQGRNYFQIILSESGKLLTARSIDGKWAAAELDGLKTAVRSEKKFWHVLISIPFSTLGMQPPSGSGTASLRFNFCRRNADLPALVKNGENSSFSILSKFNYHIPATWSTAIFSLANKNSAESHRCWIASDGAIINLIPNSEFLLSRKNFLAGWHYLSPKDVVRQETAEFSGDWILRCTNRSYQVASVLIPGLKQNATYTFRILVKSFGGTNAIGILPLIPAPDGKKYHTGKAITWKLPVSQEHFKEYTIPFTLPKGTAGFSFYRFGEKKSTSGLDYSSIKLYQGKLSSFEIRKMERMGGKIAVPGTELLPAANPMGPAEKPCRVLAICEDLLMTRDIIGLFAGLNVKYDCITTTGVDSDLYYTDFIPQEIQEHLEKNRYDLYMTGRNVNKIGKGLSAFIDKNVQSGAGLVICNPMWGYGNLKPLIQQKAVENRLTGCLAGQGGVFDFLSQPRSDLVKLQESIWGKGHVLVYHSNRKAGFLYEDFPYETDNPFPYIEYTNVFLARLCLYAAGKLPSRILSCSVQNDSHATVTCLNVPDGTALNWKLLAKDGTVADSGKITVHSNRAAIAPVMTMTGKHLLCLRLTSKNGKTMDYAAVSLEHQGPRISTLKDANLLNHSSRPADIAYTLEKFSPDMKLHWTLEDFSGRVLESGSQQAAGTGLIHPALSALFTNYARFTLKLLNRETILDSRRIPVYVQDLDKKRLLSDFTPSIWPYVPGISRELQYSIMEQLENIGIRSLGFMWGTDISEVLAHGHGLAAGSSLAGHIFHGVKQDSHVRKQQFNTAKQRKGIARTAYHTAKKFRYLGAISNNICDEVSLCRKDTSDELDSHPENLAEYRRRMKNKYGTIENFNKICGSSYPDFEKVGHALIADARKTGRFAEFIEWRNFNTDRWCEAIKLMADQTKKANPDSLFAIPNTFGQGALGGNDYWKLLTKCNLDFSHEYTSMVYLGGMTNPSPIYDFDEFYRSFAPDMRLWGYMGYVNSLPRLLYQPWWFAMHRYGGLTWFSATSCLIRSYGLSSAWNLVDIPNNGLTVDAAQLKRSFDSSELLKGIGKLFLAYKWIPNDIAVYYSHNSLLVSFCLSRETKEGEIAPSGPLHDYYFSRHNVRYLLENQLYQYDFVSSEQVEKGLLSRRRALFMPGIVSLSEKEIAALKTFLKQGGRIISDFAPGLYDELGRKRNTSPLAGCKGILILNKIFNEKNKIQVQKILSQLDSAGSAPILKSDCPDLAPGREAMHFQDADMHVFTMIRHPLKADKTGMQTLTFPVKGHIYDLLQGKYLGEGSQARAHLKESSPAAVFGVYPSRIQRLAVRMPGEVKAGHDLCADIAAETAGPQPEGKHVFHLEIVHPGTRTRHFMMRNIIAPGGKTSFRFRMASNDAQGKWILKLKDIMTGQTAEHPFVLK